MYLSSLQMIRDRPWTGFGLGTWPTAYPRYALYDDGTFVNQAHNDWAQWTVEGGIPFLVLLVILVIPAVPAALHTLWGVGVLSVLAHGFVDYPFQQRPALGACCFVLLGALRARARTGVERC
jgi:O-antigen ligase